MVNNSTKQQRNRERMQREAQYAKDRLNGKRRQGRGLSSFAFKIIGITLTTIGVVSHSYFAYAIVRGTADGLQASFGALTIALFTEVIAWIALPIYAWLLVQGFKHTSSFGKYFLRVLILAIVCEVPYDLTNTWVPFDMRYQNPVWGLVLCLVVLWFFRSLEGKTGVLVWLQRVIVVIAGVAYMYFLHVANDEGIMYGGIVMFGYTLIFYAFEKRENTMMMVGSLWGITGVMLPSIGLIPLHFHNDERGYTNPAAKWVFYALYPLVLLIFGLIHLAG